MKCKLCLKEKQLLRRSHIIPNFMYKGLRDESNKFFLVENEDYSNPQKRYTGEFESNMLCQECDNKVIGQYEDYAYKSFYRDLINGESIVFENQKKQNGLAKTIIKEVDYKKFKLFLLTLLWRSSISSREFFDQVKLGPHEEIIRKMILDGDPGKPMDYPCLISTYLGNKDKFPSDLLVLPKRFKDNNGTRYELLIEGLVYMFFISKHRTPRWLSNLVMNESNEIAICHMSEELGADMLNNLLGVKGF